MRKIVYLCALALLSTRMMAASKIHVVSFGKWQSVQVEAAAEAELIEIRVRSLAVDGKVKEYTFGQPHDVTERVFVVRRLVRLNDALANEKTPRWIWQSAGWIQVDRVSGRITPLNLPNFDPQISLATWYRDYVAYCGPADDARVYAVVVQLGVRRPILRKLLDGETKPASTALSCSGPVWQRRPIRVEFGVAHGPNLTFTVRNRALELTAAEEDDSE